MTATEQGSQPDPQDIEDAVTAAAPVTGELFARAIFASFFHRPIVGMTPEMSGSGPGMPGMPPMLQYGPSPVQQVANELWQRYGEQAKQQIAQAIDVADVIERVAERVHQRLVEDSERDDRFSSYRDKAHSFADVQRITREKLAEKLSDRQMAAYDAEQAEMRAAWQREQQRMRDQPAELESGGAEDDD